MRITLFTGYPDYIGRRMAFAGVASGPASLGANGDKLDPFRHTLYYDAVHGGTTPDGAFSVQFQPSAAEVRADWFARWIFGSTGSVASATQAAAGSGMTPGTYTVNGTGGGGTGAQLSVTVNATTITALTVLSPGKGYTTAPTFSLAAAGGTPATISASLSTAGQPVAAGANLSSEQVIVSGFCGQY
jgi:uncharacterized protein with FMN-binding domain